MKAISPSIITGVIFALSIGPGLLSAQETANPVVVIETSKGTITAELFKDKAPKSVDNFLAYAKAGFYNGTIFHRVIKGFMIQGGGMTAEMARKETRPPIVNEAKNGLSNAKGTLAMARTSEVNSATAQFFINTVDNARLDNRGDTPDVFGYAVFGKVIEGMDVVEKIEGVATGSRAGHNNVPMENIVIKSVRIK